MTEKEIKKVEKKLAEAYKPIVNFQKNMQTIAAFATGITKQLSPFINQMAKLGNQLALMAKILQKNFEEGLDALLSPKTYRKTNVKIPERIHNTAIKSVIDIDRNIHKQNFKHLKPLIETGLEAHLNKNYELSVFAIFSSIDGILTSYYCKHNNCRAYPSFQKKIDYFINKKYKFNSFLSKPKFKRKLEIFVQHRNQIMHGGKYAHFDRNISTISLLFLNLVYYSIAKK